jgi:hypothetical protein
MRSKIIKAIWFGFLSAIPAMASENLPQKPFGAMAKLPAPGELDVTPWYTYTRWKNYWTHHARFNIERLDEDDFELNNGMVLLDYGLCSRAAVDLTAGYTSAATRFFDPIREPRTTQGLMDVQLGVRYALWSEAEHPDSLFPNAALRFGGIIQGSYTPDFPFAPGGGASGVEPSLIVAKTFAPCGFGYYADLGGRYRDHHVPATVFGSAGLSETVHFDRFIESLAMNFGYRHDQDLGGRDITGTFTTLSYDRRVKEVNQMLEGGVSVTDKGGRRYQFYMGCSLDGRNTGDKLVYGLYASIPVGGK